MTGGGGSTLHGCNKQHEYFVTFARSTMITFHISTAAKQGVLLWLGNQIKSILLYIIGIAKDIYHPVIRSTMQPWQALVRTGMIGSRRFKWCYWTKSVPTTKHSWIFEEVSWIVFLCRGRFLVLSISFNIRVMVGSTSSVCWTFISFVLLYHLLCCMYIFVYIIIPLFSMIHYS